MWFIITAAFVYTPLKEMIPGYPDGKVTQQLILNQIKLDSIEHQLRLKQQYIDNLKIILSGGVPKKHIEKNKDDTNIIKGNLDFKKSKEDSILRAQIEEEERFAVNINQPANVNMNDIHKINFFPPVRGIVTGSFNRGKKSFGS